MKFGPIGGKFPWFDDLEVPEGLKRAGREYRKTGSQELAHLRAMSRIHRWLCKLEPEFKAQHDWLLGMCAHATLACLPDE